MCLLVSLSGGWLLGDDSWVVCPKIRNEAVKKTNFGVAKALFDPYGASHRRVQCWKMSNSKRFWNSCAINSSNQNAFSHLRDLRPSFKMAVQLQDYVLPFGSEPRPSKKKTHLVFREAKRVSRERGISWSTQDQQKSKLWVREVRFSRGHWERSIR